MRTRLALATVAAIAAWPGPAELAAQTAGSPNTLSLDDPSGAPAAAIEDVAWVAGHWRGEDFGGVFEEIWSEPWGGTMLGMYRHLREGKPVFYELLMIAPQGESLVLRVRHFHPDFTGWEEKDRSVDFPLVRVTPDEAYFDGLTVRRVDENTLRVFLRMRLKGGEVREEEFVYRRVGR